ncbi:hypothetical protein QA648_28265 (plasmid) [Rhizobium sp. CB3171]|uniref:hypothetical protein n=1 Tax=Rhizobium sp. CB3171 TaxID=3039157 RepID=UPI0024B0B241|nr:hypothetical protein [Rhizobium sp. CB3171]WFU04664.1 hypothetical protein QA648_28265 [Rhizobium sp. CB3171]
MDFIFNPIPPRYRVGYGFVPSADWVSATSSFRISAGLASAVLLLWSVLRGLDNIQGELKKIGAVLISPFMGYFVGSTPVVIGVPMIVTAFAGHHVELTYHIEQADGGSRRGCSSPVDLQGLPFMFKSLCGVSNDLRKALKPGMKIIAEGRGSGLGLYASNFHRIDQ